MACDLRGDRACARRRPRDRHATGARRGGACFGNPPPEGFPACWVRELYLVGVRYTHALTVIQTFWLHEVARRALAESGALLSERFEETSFAEGIYPQSPNLDLSRASVGSLFTRSAGKPRTPPPHHFATPFRKLLFHIPFLLTLPAAHNPSQSDAWS